MSAVYSALILSSYVAKLIDVGSANVILFKDHPGATNLCGEVDQLLHSLTPRYATMLEALICILVASRCGRVCHAVLLRTS